jgi:hypothetical protein
VLHQFFPPISFGVNARFGYPVDPRCRTACIGKHGIETDPEPSRIADEAIQAFVTLMWVCERALCKLRLNFQDMCRIHD